MAFDFVSYTVDTVEQETAPGFDGVGLAQDSIQKTVKAVGEAVLDAGITPNRKATGTITVKGSDAGSAVTTIHIEVVPTITTSNPLTEAQLAEYDAFVGDMQTAVGTVETGITWA